MMRYECMRFYIKNDHLQMQEYAFKDFYHAHRKYL